MSSSSVFGLLAGAGALVVAALAGIWFATRDPDTRADPRSPEAGQRVAEPSPAPAERPVPPAPPAPPPAGRVAATTGVAHPAAADPARPPVLRPSRRTYDLFAGLGELQARTDRCADGARPEAFGDRSRTILWLELETLSGKVRIADAEVEKDGGASPELVACALGVLRGQEVRMRAARPGGRLRIQYPLVFSPKPSPAR